MKEKVIEHLDKLKKQGLKNINVIGLVSKRSSEVIFFCEYKGKIFQSNDLFEYTDDENLENALMEFDDNIPDIMRLLPEFKEDVYMNCIKIDNDGDYTISYLTPDDHEGDIIDRWIDSLEDSNDNNSSEN